MYSTIHIRTMNIYIYSFVHQTNIYEHTKVEKLLGNKLLHVCYDNSIQFKEFLERAPAKDSGRRARAKEFWGKPERYNPILVC